MQRGWKLPKAQYVLPNVISSNRGLARTRKPVYRAVFFGRLEERKGLVSNEAVAVAVSSCKPDQFCGYRACSLPYRVQKMIIDIVESLPDDVRNNPMFELIFLGADSKVIAVSDIYYKHHCCCCCWHCYVPHNACYGQHAGGWDAQLPVARGAVGGCQLQVPHHGQFAPRGRAASDSMEGRCACVVHHGRGECIPQAFVLDARECTMR